MKKKEFEVVIEEVLRRTITVLAYDDEDAKDQVNSMYRSEDIILDSSDLSLVRIFESKTQIN